MLSLESLAHPSGIASLLLAVLVFLYWYGTRGFADLKKLNVPGPKPLPFLGSFLHLRKYNGLHLLCVDYVKKYGKVFAICLGTRPTLVITEPELAKQIMTTDFQKFRNRIMVQRTRFPHNLVEAKDEKWKRIRNILTPTFSTGKIKLMVPLIEKSCDTLMTKLENIADSVQSVDMQEWLSKLTLELILSTAFGVDANIQVGENIEMLENAKLFFQVPPIVRRLARLPVASTIIGFLGRLRGNLDYFGDLAQHVIKTRRQRCITGRKDLLQLMMDAHDEKTGENVCRLTDDEIVAQSILFLLAGSDTTGNTLSFIVYFLAVNPDVQEELRIHIEEAMKSNAEESLYDMAKGIEYLDCVIKETLRLCPTLPMINRECSEAHDLNGMHIPAGTEILFAPYVMHRDPDAWPDPEKFDPERFRGPAKDTRHAFQFLPFGAGPRSCIGMRFALIEIKIVLVKILMKYKFERSPETKVPLDIHEGFTLMAKDGVLVRVRTI